MKKTVRFGIAAAVAGWLLWGNSALMVSCYRIGIENLPAGFEGVRIAQISDLHNAEFGRDNEKLLARLRKTVPDIIVITGDLIDSRKTNMEVSLAFAREAAKLAPCYYVTGNHEARVAGLNGFLESLSAAGITVLQNEAVPLARNGDAITLMGLNDPVMVTKRVDGNDEAALRDALTALTATERGFTILLSHRPEWFSLYREFGMDLVFSGHAHGGQVRLPFVGGLIAPNQWFFPEYDAGVFREGTSAMVVSRGIGPSIIPLRINNRPEIVVAELHREG